MSKLQFVKVEGFELHDGYADEDTGEYKADVYPLLGLYIDAEGMEDVKLVLTLYGESLRLRSNHALKSPDGKFSPCYNESMGWPTFETQAAWLADLCAYEEQKAAENAHAK